MKDSIGNEKDNGTTYKIVNVTGLQDQCGFKLKVKSVGL